VKLAVYDVSSAAAADFAFLDIVASGRQCLASAQKFPA
jgi:hypothetical protein